MCRVLLAAKNPEGQVLFCGNPALLCKRRTHQEKQADHSKRAMVGVYEGVRRSNRKIVDGIVESFVSFEDREKHSRDTLRDMEAAIYSSSLKKSTEETYHPKTPSSLTFNLEEQPPSSRRSRQQQMEDWRDGLGGGPTPLSVPTRIPETPGPGWDKTGDAMTSPTATELPADPSMIAATLERLASAMEQKLDRMQSNQERLNEGLVQELKAAVQRQPRLPPKQHSATLIDLSTDADRSFGRTEPRGPPINPINIALNVPPTVDIAPGLPSNRGPTRYYAVAIGCHPGILLSWKAVLALVSGFPHAKYKSFRRRPPAEEWYLQQRQLLGLDQDLSGDDSSFDGTVDFNADGIPSRSTDRPSGLPRPTATTRPPEVYPNQPRRSSNADLVDFRMAGPDPSTGDPKKIHNVSINISSEVRDLLCPKGLTVEMQSRMLEATPDVLTCQGKSSVVKIGSEFELESMWNRFAGAMTDMADVQAQRIGTQTRDTQWSLPSRNSIGKIKSLNDMLELAKELASNRTNVLDNAKSNFMEVLFMVGWTLEDATIYCEQGGLILLVTRMYDNLYALVQQIIGKAFQHPEAWEQIGQPRIDHHASQLGQFRVFSNR
jgi:hypothetical protein